MVVGVAMVLLGIVMIGTSLVFDGSVPDEVAGGAPTTSGAYGADLAPGTTAPFVGGGIGLATAPARLGRAPLGGFGEVQATITAEDGEVCDVCLLSATTPDQRARGLMGVTDPNLGGYDGMLFEYPAAIDGGFWMRNTPMPLSIAFFDDVGVVVSTADMEPCEDSPSCPSYPAAAPFRFALEVPQGRLEEVGVRGRATIVINARACTEAPGGA